MIATKWRSGSACSKKVAKFKERAAAIESIDYATPRGLRKEQILESV